MALDGPNLCTASSESGALTSWGSIGNVTSSDNVYTTCFIMGNSSTNTLFVSGFNLKIPQGAVIEGIMIDFDRLSTNGTFQDSNIRLGKTGTPVTGNYSTGLTWSTSEVTTTIGSVSELWGTTWTPEELNASTFGVYLTATQTNAGGSDTASIDTVKVSVKYSGGAIPALLIL